MPDNEIQNGLEKLWDRGIYTYELTVEELEEYNKQFDISQDKQITSIKSQLKHCNNYLEHQNIERRLNRLYKERR